VQKSGLGWLAEKLRPKGSYPPLCGADELVHWKAPISEFVSRGITAQNLAESGIKLDAWFGYGYSLGDLQKIGVTWNDMVFMGFGPQMLKFVSASFLVDVLKADISHLMQVGITSEHLAQAGFGFKDMCALKCTTHTLINMGMHPEQMATFKLSQKEWEALAMQN
jgi:hypothetical protein